MRPEEVVEVFLESLELTLESEIFCVSSRDLFGFNLYPPNISSDTGSLPNVELYCLSTSELTDFLNILNSFKGYKIDFFDHHDKFSSLF